MTAHQSASQHYELAVRRPEGRVRILRARSPFRAGAGRDRPLDGESAARMGRPGAGQPVL